MEIRTYQQDDFDDVITLWENCDLLHPWNDPEAEIERKQHHGVDLFLVAEVAGSVVATLMGGYDGHSGWADYLAVHPDFRGRGIANALLSRIEKKLIARGCPKVQLLISDSHHAVLAMCEKLGYEVQDTICLSKRLIVDQEY